MSGSRDINITLDSLLGVDFERVDAGLRKQLKALSTKEKKQAFLEQYSQNPWIIPSSEAFIPGQTAFDYLLRLGRKTGKLCDSTESSREYACLKSAKDALRDHQNPFNQELELPLDRSAENPYYARAQQHMQADQHHRAIFDFSVARALFQQQDQAVLVEQCTRELIVLYYYAGMDFRAYTELQEARTNNIPQQPMGKVMGALALVRNHRQNPHVNPPFNPLQVMCEALAESQAPDLVNAVVMALKEDGFILHCLEKHCADGHDLMIDLFSFLPLEMRRDVLEKNKAINDHAFLLLYPSLKFLSGVPFDDSDSFWELNGAQTLCRSVLELPISLKCQAYPGSVVVAFERVLALDSQGLYQESCKMLTRCLEINPAYLPARLLSLQRSCESLNDLMPVFRDIFSKHPDCVDAYALAYSKAALQQKPDIASLCESADQFVRCYDKLNLENPSDELKDIYNQAKVHLIAGATGRRECIERFLACDPEDKKNYPQACAALKNKFKRGDRIFTESVEALLQKGELLKAILLCAANDKTTDVNNLLLKNTTAPVYSHLERAYQKKKLGEKSVMDYFSNKKKMQGVIDGAFAPKVSHQSRFAPGRSSASIELTASVQRRTLFGVQKQ